MCWLYMLRSESDEETKQLKNNGNGACVGTILTATKIVKTPVTAVTKQRQATGTMPPDAPILMAEGGPTPALAAAATTSSAGVATSARRASGTRKTSPEAEYSQPTTSRRPLFIRLLVPRNHDRGHSANAMRVVRRFNRSAKSSGMILLALACLLCAPVHGQESVGQGGGTGSRNSPYADDFKRASCAAPISATSLEANRLAPVAFRSGRGGLFAHHWVEVQTSTGSYTLGFGPALIPFIDRGQITVEDRYGHIEWRYLLHPFSLHWNFARAPGIGRNIATVAYLPISKADALVENQRHRHPMLPYIPFFHDCRTYVCTVQASTQGRSRLPCYLLLKGYR